MTTTYKYKSRLITAISFIITILAFISADEWASVLPQDLVVFAPTIVAVIGYIASQLSEEKRVVVAEEIAVKKAETEPAQVGEIRQPIILNEEYIEPVPPVEENTDEDTGC